MKTFILINRDGALSKDDKKRAEITKYVSAFAKTQMEASLFMDLQKVTISPNL